MEFPDMKKQLTTAIGLGALSLFLLGATPNTMAAPTGQDKQVKRPLTPKLRYENPLAGTQWELVSPVYRGLKQKPTLQFDEGRLFTSVGLNRISGGYSVDLDVMSVYPLISTKMGGPREVMAAENALSKAVQSAKNFQLSKDGRSLTLYGSSTLVWRRTGSTAVAVNPLANTQWEVDSPTFPGVQKRPTLNITEKSLGPSVGLNAIGGGYTVKGNTIKVERMISTMMAGSTEVMKAERALIKAIEGARTFELSPDGQHLTLRGSSTLQLRRIGKSETVANPLAWTEWELTSPTYRGLKKTPTLKISDKGLSPSVGLNVVNGGYTVKGNTIKVESLISTMMAGPQEIMEAERALNRGVQEAKTFELTQNGQRLTLRGSSTLTFRRTGTTAQGFVPAETKIISVGPQLGPEMDGDKSPNYLQLEDLSEGVSWGKFTERKIEGFNFVPDYRYQLRVVVERNQRTGEKRLRALEVFSQQWMRTATLAANHKILEVAPTEVDCIGVAPRKCLQVREAGGQWQTFSAPIEGFTFEDGWRYRLQVAVTPVKNPPADGSSLRYQLVRVLDKMPVTY
jgi:heat shock protein HslJ